MARWELAPGSPWKAIFGGLVMARSSSRSAFCQYPARGLKVCGRVDAARDGTDNRDIDPHAGLERAQLLEFLLALQRRRRQRYKASQRFAAVGVEPDMMIARALAMRGGCAGKIQRAQPPLAE